MHIGWIRHHNLSLYGASSLSLNRSAKCEEVVERFFFKKKKQNPPTEPPCKTRQPKATGCSAAATIKHNKTLCAFNSSTDISLNRNVQSNDKDVKSGWTPSTTNPGKGSRLDPAGLDTSELLLFEENNGEAAQS